MKTKYDLSRADRPCEALGYVYAWDGYFEAQQELVCKSCGEIISNCLTCPGAGQCSLCASPYQAANVTDDFGNMHQVCLKNFCGVSGSGPTC